MKKLIVVLIIVLAAVDAFLIGVAIGRTLMPRKDDSVIRIETPAEMTWDSSSSIVTWEDVITEEVLTEEILTENIE